MPKGWLYVEIKTNAEREEQRQAPGRHILTVERREKNFVALLSI
jgi:hypothetical protein